MQFKTKTVPEANVALAGTQFENQEAKALVVDFARDPMKAYAFNIASMAFNNHFFFRGINTNPDVVSKPPSDLAIQIKNDFGSMDTLRATFLATADAMFGPGFVWLVQLNESAASNPLRILPTYIAGSPLSGAHYRRQSHDLNEGRLRNQQTVSLPTGPDMRLYRRASFGRHRFAREARRVGRRLSLGTSEHQRDAGEDE